ncbi:MAG: hypothetical protein A2552_11185 [Sulfuricurvum sp. RIFOXYD2_FULL_44_160]|uniref:DUF4154 domain-containing protein n=1 Tax=Sulfuricurvum kujiense TaxID=148813 RepID=A0A2D3WBF0_9BACT|nr:MULTISPECIES: YfiR family protein [Sulfuricurvum]OHD94530.1 MAG: hypothetical protein A2517_03410 [Sulfuricurvum sp. RIFOXYD12_FULL_44_77]OHD98626.1 MAG: hypothetical protein A2552_11185 [Sulfuricurvum sp. RIFOXYD2_FULL_44_160]DAB37748.1 MAG TPA: hypothetical protein CFH83_09480 [Sulfuricurvum kujiense]
MRQLVLFLIFVVSFLRADALPEYTIKAAYLYNFALLTDWHDGKMSGDFNICFYKEDFGSASNALNNKVLHNQNVKISTVTTAEETKECQIVFIREGEEQRGEKLIQKLAGTSVLIVSESPKISDAHITMLRDNRKIAFDINLKPIKAADLSVSSRLLKLARRVEQ